MITRRLVDLEKITEMLLEDRKLAHDYAQASAAVAASLGLAKLHGLVVNRVQQQISVLDRLSYAELQALEQALTAIQGGTETMAAIMGEGVLPDPDASSAVPLPDSPTEPPQATARRRRR